MLIVEPCHPKPNCASVSVASVQPCTERWDRNMNVAYFTFPNMSANALKCEPTLKQHLTSIETFSWICKHDLATTVES